MTETVTVVVTCSLCVVGGERAKVEDEPSVLIAVPEFEEA